MNADKRIRSAAVVSVATGAIGSQHLGDAFDMEIAIGTATSAACPSLSGNRPLFAGEDAAACDSLLGRVSDVVKPADVLEEIWIQDVVDLSWEVAKLRRLKAEFLNSSAHRGLRKLLDGLLGWKESQDLTAQWAGKDPDAIKLVASSLAAAGMTMNTVMAQTLTAAIDEVEWLDRLTAAAELRRNAVLREIADYRSVFAAHLRRAGRGLGVTVSRRAAASRRGAWRSTGPLTALGKRTVARNALRHGLNVPVFADAVLAKEVVELAELIANGSTDPELRELAVRVAEAQIDVKRVRHARHALIGASVTEPRSGTAREKIQELVVLDRYERRAMSRRKSAILAFGVALLLSDNID